MKIYSVTGTIITEESYPSSIDVNMNVCADDKNDASNRIWGYYKNVVSSCLHIKLWDGD